MATNDFLPFGTAAGANVMSQADYQALSARSTGFQAGTAASAQLNKAWRQASIMASMLAQFIVDQSGQNAVDDGAITTLQANLLVAIRAAGRQTTILVDTGVVNAYAAANAPALTALPATGYSQQINIANANTGPATYAPDGLAARPIYGLALQPLQGGELPAGVAVLMYLVQAGVNGGNGAWILIESLGGAAQVTPASKSLHAVNAGQIQTQAVTAFTTSGTAPAFTLTASPAITGLAAGQRFRISFNAAGTTGSNTLNVNGLGAKNLMQFDSSGALQSAIVTSGLLSDVEYNGTSWVVLDPLPAQVNNLVGLQGAVKNLVASATGANAVVSITADEIILESSSNAYQVVRGVTLSPSLANSGAGGLDTGTSATNTWYSVWVIWNGTSASGLFSLSATAPTMPAGYTHKARIGWVRTDGTGNKYPLSFVQAGATVQYKIVGGTNVPSMPLMASGNSGDPSTPTWIAIPIAAFVPPTAAKIVLTLSLPLATSAAVMVAPNPSYGAYNSSTNPPPHGLSGGGAIVPSSAQCSLALETTSIYWAANSPSARLYVGGWEDNL